MPSLFVKSDQCCIYLEMGSMIIPLVPASSTATKWRHELFIAWMTWVSFQLLNSWLLRRLSLSPAPHTHHSEQKEENGQCPTRHGNSTITVSVSTQSPKTHASGHCTSAHHLTTEWPNAQSSVHAAEQHASLSPVHLPFSWQDTVILVSTLTPCAAMARLLW